MINYQEILKISTVNNNIKGAAAKLSLSSNVSSLKVNP